VSGHPYRELPDRSFWRRSVATPAPADVDPVGDIRLRIEPDTRVATAGSCFAQHISRHLKGSGYRFFVAEEGHPALTHKVRQRAGYGLFSARYGNIYTARQLLQLMQRAFGSFRPEERVWRGEAGEYLDPFRPTVQPGGFVNEAEMLADRAQHLAAVRRMFESLDVLVFTLGLTECWRSRVDGAVFPLCPGVSGGTFDASRHEFYNQDLTDVVQDLEHFREQLQIVNPNAQLMLTVSPVPLAATASPAAHVLAATTYSKSVLRVAAGSLAAGHANVHYFPSFEIITGAHARGRYYAEDLRNVLEEGVSHVMRVFFRHLTAGAVPAAPAAQLALATDRYVAASTAIVDVECDESALER